MKPARNGYVCANCATPVAVPANDIKKVMVVIHTSSSGRIRVVTLPGRELHRCTIPHSRKAMVL